MKAGDELECWRCATCGKWSHAKRRPQRHDRWDVMASNFVTCGPFTRWIARADEDDRIDVLGTTGQPRRPHSSASRLGYPT